LVVVEVVYLMQGVVLAIIQFLAPLLLLAVVVAVVEPVLLPVKGQEEMAVLVEGVEVAPQGNLVEQVILQHLRLHQIQTQIKVKAVVQANLALLLLLVVEVVRLLLVLMALVVLEVTVGREQRLPSLVLP
jgi:hypothetical protein